jgi:type II secretory ATPase GspE/PulE/Tfp pilus assembly ATPase PilB-like protein
MITEQARCLCAAALLSRRARAVRGVCLAAAIMLALAASGASAGQPPANYSFGVEQPKLYDPPLLALSIVKLILLAVFTGVVFYVDNWALLDMRFVNTSPIVWGVVILLATLAGVGTAALVPFFWIGLPLGIILYAGAAMTYANHRNSLVTPPLRVLTGAHLERIKRRLSGRKPVDSSAGVYAGAGRDIIFMGLDDLPIRPAADSELAREANAEVERVLYDAIVRRASMVGFIARPQKGEVRLRIDGEMFAGGNIDRPVADHFPAAVKRLAGLDPAETRKPQEGRCRAVVSGQTFDLRVKTAGTVKGEQVAIRIVDLLTSQRRLEDLGMSADQVTALKEALSQRPGLVLVSSPKDSGLTTTLHACLRYFDRYLNNVILFEAHPEVEIENVQHVALNQEDGPVASAEVRSRVRMEPDVVGIDSLYLADVAQILAEAANEHTVVIGLRAADSGQAITRAGGLFGSREPLARRLQIVLNQRLVRLLCPECREAYRPNPEFVRKANLGSQRVEVLHRAPTRAVIRDGKEVVCPRCHNDRYIGRTAIFELMPINDEARGLIERSALTDLRTYARKLGMRNLQEQGLQMVIEGRTSIEEVLRAIKQET